MRDGWVVTRRNLIKYKRIPDLLIFSTIQPIMFVLLFAYVFGGAIPIQGVDYRQFLMPGVFLQPAPPKWTRDSRCARSRNRFVPTLAAPTRCAVRLNMNARRALRRSPAGSECCERRGPRLLSMPGQRSWLSISNAP